MLDKLNELVKEFVYRVGKLKGLSETDAKNAGGKILVYGSYRLGVYNAGKEIDHK